MSSPHVGLQPELEELNAANLINSRPFSASGERGGELLTVLVHFGRNLEALVNRDALIEQDRMIETTAGKERLNTYVVASIGAFAASSDIVQCHRGMGSQAINPSTSALEERVSYERKCSLYAATRVVSETFSPCWNEMLALPLPLEWLKVSATNQQQLELLGDEKADCALRTMSSSRLALKLELVEREDSHQEDFLLGTCILPLADIWSQLQQSRFALVFPPADTKSTIDQDSSACIYVSLHSSICKRVPDTNSFELVEILVETFTPVVVTDTEHEDVSSSCTSLAVLVNFEAGKITNSSQLDPEVKHAVLENHFTYLQDGQALSKVHGDATNRDIKKIGITPSSTSITGSASGVYEWFFPLSYALAAESVQSASTVTISLFQTSSMPYKLVGHGQLHIPLAFTQGVQKDGSPLRQTVIPITFQGESLHLLGHVALRLRWWDLAAWSTFMSQISARRIVCTNRWRRSSRRTLPWMGALLRGLNRQPVASVCDTGGVSGVLAELLATTGLGKNCTENPELVLHSPQPQQDTRTSLQSFHIETRQNEIKMRLPPITTCDSEIVALKNELRRKDEQLRKLSEQVEITQRLEQQQVADILVSSNGVALCAKYRAASQQFTLLATQYKKLNCKYAAIKHQLTDAQRLLSSFTDLEIRYIKLQETHLKQATIVQDLQRDEQHVIALKKTVRIQEKVIRQFEQAVAQQLSHKIEQHSTTTSSMVDVEDCSRSATREVLMRGRVCVLEQQLQTNAREATAKTRDLRLRVLELEKAQSRRTGV